MNYLKFIFITIVVLAIMAVGATAALKYVESDHFKPMQYVASTTTKVIEPEWAVDEDAKAAAQAVIRKKELQAELDALKVDIKALEDRKTEVEKELGTY